MKKEFLDYLYNLKSLIEADIERLVKIGKNPKQQCCEKMGGQDENMAELRTRRSQLSSLDKTIVQYLDKH